VVDDRQKLSTEGVVNIVAKISTQTGRMVDRPVVTSYGLVPDREDKQFAKEIEQLIEIYLVANKVDPSTSNKVIEDDLRGAVRKHILKRYKKYPIIIPTVFLV
jgi:ribonuclease J